MQSHRLSIPSLLEFAARNHGHRSITSRTVEGPIHRYTYRGALARSKRLANALGALGVKPGDRVATFAWNTHRHFELYYATSGSGAVLHTVNPRLFADQIEFIVNHAEDRVVFVDLTFVPLLEELAPKLPSVKRYVVMTDRAHMPETSLPQVLCYEELLQQASDEYAWPDLDEETAAALCYTSGTTGDPKGVLFSHRSTVLHAWAVTQADGIGVASRDTIFPIVPMFHANCWGFPYGAALAGAALVFPGDKLDGESLFELIDGEQVTLSAGVPTVWLALFGHLAATHAKLPHLERVVIGGSAAPRSMLATFETEYNVDALHAWGMTETSPLATVSRVPRALERAALETRLDIKVTQGRPLFGVELKIVDDEGNELPRDGKTPGNLLIRGPWITRQYYGRADQPILDDDGWFNTGDVATLDAEGYMHITDRAKDMIKSGGEWISSIELENLAVGHPGVAEAAVIAAHHPKWAERPLLVAVRTDKRLTKEKLLSYMAPKLAKWSLPDDVCFVEELPHTATGKVKKAVLREQFKGHRLPAT